MNMKLFTVPPLVPHWVLFDTSILRDYDPLDCWKNEIHHFPFATK